MLWVLNWQQPNPAQPKALPPAPAAAGTASPAAPGTVRAGPAERPRASRAPCRENTRAVRGRRCAPAAGAPARAALPGPPPARRCPAVPRPCRAPGSRAETGRQEGGVCPAQPGRAAPSRAEQSRAEPARCGAGAAPSAAAPARARPEPPRGGRCSRREPRGEERGGLVSPLTESCKPGRRSFRGPRMGSSRRGKPVEAGMPLSPELGAPWGLRAFARFGATRCGDRSGADRGCLAVPRQDATCVSWCFGGC